MSHANMDALAQTRAAAATATSFATVVLVDSEDDASWTLVGASSSSSSSTSMDWKAPLSCFEPETGARKQPRPKGKLRWKTQEATGQILAKFTGKAFVSVRPAWLEGLELDWYCEELKLACEVMGDQHTKRKHWFHKTPQSFDELHERDARKFRLCRARGIDVIYVHPMFSFKRMSELEMFVFCELKLRGLMLELPSSVLSTTATPAATTLSRAPLDVKQEHKSVISDKPTTLHAMTAAAAATAATTTSKDDRCVDSSNMVCYSRRSWCGGLYHRPHCSKLPKTSANITGPVDVMQIVHQVQPSGNDEDIHTRGTRNPCHQCRPPHGDVQFHWTTGASKVYHKNPDCELLLQPMVGKTCTPVAVRLDLMADGSGTRLCSKCQ